MTDASDAIRHLDDTDAWALLQGTHTARLAVSVGQIPDIYPITTYCQDQAIGFRTIPGTKLASLMTNHRVAVEWDDMDSEFAWSVVMHADAERTRVDEALASGLIPTVAVETEDWIRLSPLHVTARRFRRAVAE
jgi:nitroimidazol reductase NimA-like FMN-containing flavoprotein (pyridoxamine 5'-phosphate oxidase superfamily)